MITPEVTMLETLIPDLKKREEEGAIRVGSTRVAQDLVRKAARFALSERQQVLVRRLIGRAKGVRVAQSAVNVDAIVERVLEQVNKNRGDIDHVSKLVLEKLEARVPRKVEITIKAGTKAKKIEGAFHPQFANLLKAATSKLDNGYTPGIFLAGEASSGKTTGGRMLAEALGLKWHFNGAISFPHEMLGFIDGHGKYHTTPFREAYEHGGVYTFDEVDRSDPNALLAVNPHLANGIATFPDKQIKRHKDCIIICTANTWGLGADANYSGATKLDAAFLSRFPVRLSWDIDTALERDLVSHPEWLSKVRRARQRARDVGLKVLIDTRIAQAGYALIQAGFSIEEAAQMTYLANLKPEQRTQIEGTVS